MSKYETKVSSISDSISAIYTMMTNGSAITNLKDFVFHLWNVLGYLLGITFGPPTGEEVLAGAIGTDSPNREELKKLEVLHKYQSMVVYGAHDRKNLNPIQIISLAKIILDLLKSLGVFDATNKDVPSQSLDTPAGFETTEVKVVVDPKKLTLAKKADAGDEKAISQISKDSVAQGINPDDFDTYENLAKVLYAEN